ncbi:MAG: hypothetical protein LKJ86_10555, partial [Oscillibacter sp.]|nr:hypothetical protein [Oscillibacter sp.]
FSATFIGYHIPFRLSTVFFDRFRSPFQLTAVLADSFVRIPDAFTKVNTFFLLWSFFSKTPVFYPYSGYFSLIYLLYGFTSLVLLIRFHFPLFIFSEPDITTKKRTSQSAGSLV